MMHWLWLPLVAGTLLTCYSAWTGRILPGVIGATLILTLWMVL